MNHNSYMRGPLATARDRRALKLQTITRRVLWTVVMTFFIAGALYTDHLHLMAYGY